jgi:hypothetical protein
LQGGNKAQSDLEKDGGCRASVLREVAGGSGGGIGVEGGAGRGTSGFPEWGRGVEAGSDGGQEEDLPGSAADLPGELGVDPALPIFLIEVVDALDGAFPNEESFAVMEFDRLGPGNTVRATGT